MWLGVRHMSLFLNNFFDAAKMFNVVVGKVECKVLNYKLNLVIISIECFKINLLNYKYRMELLN